MHHKARCRQEAAVQPPFTNFGIFTRMRLPRTGASLRYSPITPGDAIAVLAFLRHSSLLSITRNTKLFFQNGRG